MSETKRLPFYQDVDGYRVSGDFLPEAVRSVFTYKPKIGDFFVVTFPKCGTTWSQQIVTLIFDKGVPVSNFTEFNQRSPFLEMCGVEAADMMKKPGAMKLHTPYYFTPHSPNAKYLYVVRNPKDTVVSFFHHTRNSWYKFADGTFDEFFEIFMNGENDFGDYFDHVLSWYEHRDDPNVMFLFYEEIKRDTQNTVKKIASFIGEDYAEMLENEPDVLRNVLKYSSMEYMKCLNDAMESFSQVDSPKLDMENLPAGLKHVIRVAAETKPLPGEVFELVRKGNIGDWRSNLSEDQNRRLNQKIEEKLKGTEMYDFWKELDYI